MLIFLLGVGLLTSCASRRVALVIGNSEYSESLDPLTNPVNDARAVSEALQRLDFRVMLGLNLDRESMHSQIRQFVSTARDADVALVFYAGHGFQLNGLNYLVPIDLHGGLQRNSISFRNIIEPLDGVTKNNILILDACRTNPFIDGDQGGRSLHKNDGAIRNGLAEVRARAGTLIAFAASPGEVAYEGRGENSPFTKALLSHMEMPNVEIRTMLADVRAEVIRDTNGKQVPWDHSSLTAPFYFRRESPILSW